MKALTAPLNELACFDEMRSSLKKNCGLFSISGCVRGQRSHFIYALGDGFDFKIIACSGELRAREIYEELLMLEEGVFLYPARDLLFYQADIRSKELMTERMEVIRYIIEKKKATVVTVIDGFMDSLIPKGEVRDRILTIAEGETIDMDSILHRLVGMGYEREDDVSSRGQFAVRGGILDIYPITGKAPVRIELWGDEVDSLREFNVEDQRSTGKLSDITVMPATDYPEEKEGRVSFVDYFPEESTLIFLDEPMRLAEKGEKITEEYMEALKRRAESGYQLSEAECRLFSMKEISDKINLRKGVALSSLEYQGKDFKISETFHVKCQSMESYNRSFELLTRDLLRLKKNRVRVVLLSGSRTRARRLAEDLRDYGLNALYSESCDREVNPGEVLTTYGFVSEGYEYPLIKFVVIAETDIFGKEKKKKHKKIYEGRKIQGFSELKPGDYVVHENYGLGVYQGIEKIVIEKNAKDYMKILYDKGSHLYIPATQLDLIQKYASSEAKKPKLNRLGGQEWIRTKTRVQRAVEEIALDLVRLYAARQSKEGYVYGKDTVWQREFEEMFPFEETQDQLLAIDAVKKDMESPHIMDRLICGDVGYGKTEIAIRAAFKAVQENRQVAFLVPTTILAQQHYNTFLQRMKDYPVRVELLCRFRTHAQQKKTIEDLKRGMVDVVIGTHRLLSSDVGYKNLGLLVIDEEQRFGVMHKEKIKQLQQDVDALTLTATPIPRTLHMSLIGVRDMSVLDEAPEDRIPIQTYVMEYSEEIVREAIERERARDGQVYYVYNRVEDIAEVTVRIRRLVPEASVSYAHGQMKERELEKIMLDFINGDIDVLVSTTIIETGLDISNVNTMIIYDADRMGLSQLYQLRGRVGRAGRMAYSFMFYRRDKLLREIAEKRLVAIREFTDLGSGFKIAMRDLELRGAGNILGAAQHGHMETVGYDLYCKMLSDAVRSLKGEAKAVHYTTTVDMNVNAYIPEEYIANEVHKLDIYKRIAAVETDGEREDMMDELIDRFGDPPRETVKLLEIAELKNKAHEVFVTAIEEKGSSLVFTLFERADIKPERIPQLIEEFEGFLSFRPDVLKPRFTFRVESYMKEKHMSDKLEVADLLLNSFKGLMN